jgi:hypothetical protein
MVMDEESEGGDWLAGLTRTSSHFLDGFTRVCKAAGIAVYRRDSP